MDDDCQVLVEDNNNNNDDDDDPLIAEVKIQKETKIK
jgi:hypothetical protein